MCEILRSFFKRVLSRIVGVFSKPPKTLPAISKSSDFLLHTFGSVNAFLYSDPCDPSRSFLIDCGMGPFEEEGNGNGNSFAERQKLRKEWPRVRAVIISHGHLDHWNLLRNKPGGIPVYCAPLVRKLMEYQNSFDGSFRDVLVDTRVFVPGESIRIDGSLMVNSFPVPHSIPEAAGFCFELNGKRIVHLGEFKFKGMKPEDGGELQANLQEIGRERADLLFFDVQNIDTPGFTVSEAEVKKNLSDLISQIQGRVFVTCFSSNLERIKGLLEIADVFERPVFLDGASMQKAITVAGMTDRIADSLVFAHKNPALVLIAGSQAEQGSALWKEAYGFVYPLMKLGDTLILSSRAIPGSNERIKETIERFQNRGVNVIANTGESERLGLAGIREALIHASGHASGGDAGLVLDFLKPKKAVVRPCNLPFVALQPILDFGTEVLPFRNIGSRDI